MAVTLLQLRNAAKDVCDFVNNPQVSDPTWNQWINDGIERLYRIAFKADSGAFQTSATFTLTNASNSSTLPATYRRVLGVTKDPAVPSMRKSLPKYMWGERDSFGLQGPLSYHVVGNAVLIEPSAVCAGNYAVYYLTGPTVLVADSDTMDTILEPYDDFVTTWASIKALGKEESDNRDLYVEIQGLTQDILEMFVMRDGDDASTIVDDDSRGPSIFSIP